MSSDFYRKFEEKYRGPREVIKSRLRIYLPFVELLKVTNKEIKVVDLGCGRGEWLELLRDENVDAYGVDMDEGMLSACREKKLSVELIDALQYIKSLPDKSQDIISAFHLAEHISFGNLQILVEESQRVLKPNGLMILETPNAENIVVATRNFYLDPTHMRPIPSQLLAFLSEYYGFFRTKVLRLQESPELATGKTIALLDVLEGVSPDYSIVAQKAGPEEDLAIFNQIFEKDYGLTLATLATQYDTQISKKVEALEKMHNDFTNTRTEIAALREELKFARGEREALRAELAETKEGLKNQERMRSELENLRKELAYSQAELEARQKALANSQAEIASARAQAEEYKLQYVNILYSQSYRITAPLRSILIFIKRLQKPASKQSQDQSIRFPSEIANKPDNGLSNQDAQYFNDLLQREIDKRRNKKSEE